jgi:DNA-binding NarL/FixJ family response regulator
MIKILIADDHLMLRRGLAQILERTGEMEVVAECDNGLIALNWLNDHTCDIILLDIAMPVLNGIDFLKEVKKRKIKAPILVISAYPEEQYAIRLIKAGAMGYLNKDSEPEEIISAVHNILNGKMHMSPKVVTKLAREFTFADGKPLHETLSNREYQIFLLFAAAKSISEIATDLNLSVKTIGTYRARILEKMGMQNNLEMMQYAVNNHLV